MYYITFHSELHQNEKLLRPSQVSFETKHERNFKQQLKTHLFQLYLTTLKKKKKKKIFIFLFIFLSFPC